jgi:hypothetical protein
MGSLSDPVYINVTSHSHNADGTTRNDTFYYTTNLTTYSTDITNNMATPLYNQVLAERSNGGSLRGTFTSGEPYTGGTAASYACDLRFEIGVGFQAGATPTRYHLASQGEIADNQLTSPTVIWTYLTNLLNQFTYVNVYPGNTNLL